MSFAQFMFMVGFMLVAVAIVAVTAVMYQRARVLDGGGNPTVSNMSGLGGMQSSLTEANRWATYLHRITGVAVLLFLLLHLIDVSLFVWSVPVYDSVHELYGTTVMRIFECGLLFALCFHAFNGLRLIAIDVWDIGMTGALRLLWLTMLVSVALTLGGSVVILWPVLM
ncbi:succinate dehydrogenase, cytochrome b556 subunit [Aeromicrobium sp. CTD01-1L150]|uniref:succinate dehydrogenase, cytochrome b556 subunit n=1 Tax=Aeromicrobium sp. CTD01-1L150 TaxID=3341830 RepID=UPI0035C1A4AD